MSYKKKIYRFKNAIEIEEYHTGKYGAPGQVRQKKKAPTPEQIEKINQYNKEKLARRKLRNNFVHNDYFTCLTFRKEERPEDMNMAKDVFQKFVRKVRKEYKKRGYELKWIRNIEVGTKNGWHIHLIINRIPDTDLILKDAWTYGKVINQLLYEKGKFAQLAAYITKTPKTDPRLRESNYSTSRNLPVPDPEEKTYRHWKTWKEARVPKGYYLDKESMVEGINPVTGYKYRTYALIKINRRE